MATKLRVYFSEPLKNISIFISNPYRYGIDQLESIKLMNKIINLISDSDLKYFNGEDNYEEFYCKAYASYPLVTVIAIRMLLLFSTTSLCDKSFSTLVNIKINREIKSTPYLK